MLPVDVMSTKRTSKEGAGGRLEGENRALREEEVGHPPPPPTPTSKEVVTLRLPMIFVAARSSGGWEKVNPQEREARDGWASEWEAEGGSLQPPRPRRRR